MTTHVLFDTDAAAFDPPPTSPTPVLMWCGRCAARTPYDGDLCAGCGWPWPGR